MKIKPSKKKASNSVKAGSKSKRIMGFKEWSKKVYEPTQQRQKQVEWGGKIWTDPVFD